jgi:hypothetical protein
MEKAKQTRQRWHALYELTVKAGAVGAWEWLYEDQLFGIRVPDSPHTWYASVMGTNGEHLCYCFYRGQKGLESFLAMREKMMAMDEDNITLMRYYQLQFMRAQNCIQVSFEEEDLVDDAQLAHLEQIGIQFEGDGLWSCITDWTPSLAPWPIEEAQIDLVHTLLEKTLEVAQQYENTPDKLPVWEGNGMAMPIYTATAAADGSLVWAVTEEVVDTTQENEPDYAPLYPKGWAQLKNTPQKKVVLAAGRMMDLHGIQPSEDQRPYYIDPILIIHTETGEMLGMAMSGEETVDLEAQILQIIMDLGSRPQAVLVADELSLDLLEPCLDLAGIQSGLDASATQALAMATMQLGEMMGDMREE